MRCRILILLAALCGGCASIISDRTYRVSITSSPGRAAFIVKDDRGRQVAAGTTPSTVILRASDGYFSPASYVVNFSLPGHAPSSVPIAGGIDGWYFGNVLFGGLIGFLFVDPLTGAMWDLPSEASASLSPSR